MQTYLVGGAVRDALLGRAVQDRDWVVVGSTPEQMVAQGFVPVGRDFPVFLHPLTKEEYALARTERKTAPGYRGFVVHAAPEVTLEEDLARRDITINSIAVPAHCVRADGTFDTKNAIDPFHGAQDLQQRVLRHTSLAFVEDPVRILRVARFAARFCGFGVAPATGALMQHMVNAGEVDHLVPERVWQELATGLMEPQPLRMLEVLAACGALEKMLPGLCVTPDQEPQRVRALASAAGHHLSLAVRWAVLSAHLPQRSALLSRVPAVCSGLAELMEREYGAVAHADALSAQGLVQLLKRCDAFRKPERFHELLQACACWNPSVNPSLLSQALRLADEVATDKVATHAIATGASGPLIGQAIHDARVAALTAGGCGRPA